MKNGSLYVIPSVISEGVNKVLASDTIRCIHETRHYVVERARTARRFIKTCNPPYAIADLKIFEIESKSGEKLDFGIIDQLLQKGINVGLLSEAGCPGIADPGSGLVSYIQNKGRRVIPLVGPSSIFLALMASGLNGQEFQFHGYLPIEKDQLNKKLVQIEKLSQSRQSSHIFIETPYRNDRILEFMLKVLSPHTKLCIASDITGENESIITKKIKDWKSNKPVIGKIPTVFLIGH